MYPKLSAHSIKQKNIPDLNACVTGYQLIKYEDEAVGGKSDIDLFYFRLAEVYLNYAEALAEINQLTQDDLDISINKLRDRVGMPHLIMKTANANPDPYLLANTTATRMSPALIKGNLEIRH